MLISGDIIDLDFGAREGRKAGFRHPAVLVTAQRVLDAGPSVVHVVPLTTTIRGFHSEITIDPDEVNGLDQAGTSAPVRSPRSARPSRSSSTCPDCPPRSGVLKQRGTLGDGESVKRVSVVGNAGSGNSRLAERIAGILGVPGVELDAIHHLPGWEPIDPGTRTSRSSAGPGHSTGSTRSACARRWRRRRSTTSTSSASGATRRPTVAQGSEHEIGALSARPPPAEWSSSSVAPHRRSGALRESEKYRDERRMGYGYCPRVARLHEQHPEKDAAGHVREEIANPEAGSSVVVAERDARHEDRYDS